MNFFDHQEAARKKTKWLILLFVLSVIAMIAIINISVYLAVRTHAPDFNWRENISIFGITSLIILFTIGIGSAYKFYTLSGGGISVALSLGAKPIDPDTRDPQEKRLLNIVEEMALASGVSVPEVFVLESEPGLNAFAAGRKSSDAVITVTLGALRTLSRDELQGVIGHEFSHILNGDMNLNMRLLGLTSGINVLALTGKAIMNSTSSSSRTRVRQGKGTIQIFFRGTHSLYHWAHRRFFCKNHSSGGFS